MMRAGWSRVRAQVLLRDGYVCMYCMSKAQSVDHIVPRSKGGSDSMDNLLASCNPCNRAKSDKQYLRTTWVAPGYMSKEEYKQLINKNTTQ